MLSQSGWGIDYYHDKGYLIDYPQTAMYMLLLFKQPLTIWIEDKPVAVGADHCILYEPKTRKRYCGEEDGYYHDYLFLNGEDLGSFTSELGIPLNTPFPVNDPKKVSDLIHAVAEDTIQVQRHTDAVIDLHIRLLLYQLADAVCTNNKESQRYYRQFSELRREVFVSPEKDWNVEYLAAQLHLSISRFQHLYKEIFRSTFQQDLIKSRMGYAKNLLRNTSRPVSAVALECGYPSPEHFYRQFKKHTGITPKDYREEYGSLLS